MSNTHKVDQDDLKYLVSLLETVADPNGNGKVFHEVRLGPEVTAQARKIWKKIKNDK